jgi:hypothetical protein
MSLADDIKAARTRLHLTVEMERILNACEEMEKSLENIESFIPIGYFSGFEQVREIARECLKKVNEQ